MPRVLSGWVSPDDRGHPPARRGRTQPAPWGRLRSATLSPPHSEGPLVHRAHPQPSALIPPRCPRSRPGHARVETSDQRGRSEEEPSPAPPPGPRPPGRWRPRYLERVPGVVHPVLHALVDDVRGRLLRGAQHPPQAALH